MAGLIRSSIGIRDFALAPPLLDQSQSLVSRYILEFVFVDERYVQIVFLNLGFRLILHSHMLIHAILAY